MKSAILFGVILVTSAASAGQRSNFKLPGIVNCASGSTDHECPVELNESGHIVDRSTGKAVFGKAEPQGTLVDYALYKSGESLILEYSNTSASSNWGVLIFNYKSEIVRATNYLSLSKDMLPAKIQWSGQECHGDVALDQNSFPYKSAFQALCKGDSRPDSLVVPVTTATTGATKNGLVVSLPSYDENANSWSKATYLFVSSDSPNASRLLCMAGCSRNSNYSHLGGWIDKSLWIDISSTKADINAVSGSYFYIKNNKPIPVSGQFGEKSIDVSEYTSPGSEATVRFKGTRFGDSYVGTWSSAKKKSDFFVAIRLY
jgi:hypothetical protein